MIYEEIPLSKHDEGAYTGKMDRLFYSKDQYYLIEQLYTMRELYIENTSKNELVNVLIRERNNTINEIIKIIEENAIKTLNNNYAFNDEKN